MNTVKAKWLNEIQSWAQAHYNDSFEISAIVECWDDKDYAQYNRYRSAATAIRAVVRDLGGLNEQYAAATMDADKAPWNARIEETEEEEAAYQAWRKLNIPASQT